MTPRLLDGGLNAAILVLTVAFTAVVAVKASRGPATWLAWPPLLLIGLAAFTGAVHIVRGAVLGPPLLSAVDGAGWLIVAAVLASTRWWMHRYIRRRAAAIFARPPQSKENR